MITQRRPTLPTFLSAMTLLMASPAGAEIVFDPSVFARQFEQLTELKKQVDTLTSQLKVAQDQLNQAKQLYDSFNKRTNANDIGALLNTPQFRKVLPQQFSDIERLVDCHERRNCVRDRLFRQLLAVHSQHARTASCWAWAVVLEVEDKRVFARLERTAEEVFADSATDAAFPTIALQIEKIVNKDRFAFLQEESVATETAAERGDHSFGAAF